MNNSLKKSPSLVEGDFFLDLKSSSTQKTINNNGNNIDIFYV